MSGHRAEGESFESFWGDDSARGGRLGLDILQIMKGQEQSMMWYEVIKSGPRCLIRDRRADSQLIILDEELVTASCYGVEKMTVLSIQCFRAKQSILLDSQEHDMRLVLLSRA